VTQTFHYDAEGRRVAAEMEGRPALSERYAYDKSGNIARKTTHGETATMTYDSANQLVAKTDENGTVTEYEYDKAGRLVRETRDGETVAEYKYGYLDKVTSVTRDGETTKFHYNARGMLVAKERGGEIVGSYAWDGLALVGKNDTVYANEAHASGGVPVAAVSKNGEERYFAHDRLGTTIATYDAEGGVENHLPTSFGKGSEGEHVRFIRLRVCERLLALPGEVGVKSSVWSGLGRRATPDKRANPTTRTSVRMLSLRNHAAREMRRV
jgi:YD repeat-containing protein